MRSLPSWLPLTSGNLSGAVSCVVVAFMVLQGVSAFRRWNLGGRTVMLIVGGAGSR